jgi:hypothetical protein
MFLCSVLLRMFNLPVKEDNIANDGSCHDLGSGDHNSTEYFDQASFVWQPDKFKYNFCIAGHHNNLNDVKQTYPEIKTVLIKVDDDDIHKMATLRLYKTTAHSYNKFVKQFNITDWPPLDEVLADPNLIKESFIKYDTQWFKEWAKGIDFNLVDIVIPFKSVFGINNNQLEAVLKDKFAVTIDTEVSEYINLYQEKNRKYL